MDVSSVVFYLFAGASTLYVLHFGLYLVGANLYDMWHSRLMHRQRRSSSTLKSKPLVSILVPAHNEELVIERCLDSILKSTYQHIEVIVADDASTDATYKITRAYIKAHPNFSIRVVRMRTNVGKGAALNTAFKRYAKGKFAMMLDADSILGPKAVRNALKYFDDPTVMGVAANVRIIEEPTVLGVLQLLEHMISYRSKKLFTLSSSEFVVGGVASTYRMDILRQVDFYDTDSVTEDIGLSFKVIARGNRNHRLVYGADVTAMTEGVATFKALVRQRYRWKYGSLQNIIKYRHLIATRDPRYSVGLVWYRLPMALFSELILLLAPVFWVYVAYLTLTQFDPRLALGAYTTITVYTLITLWLDEHLSIIQRLRLSMYAPIAYFTFYIMDLVQLIAASRCLVRIRQLMKQKNIGSTWVSPERIGREVVAS